MLQFDLVDGQVVLDPKSLLVKEFKAIWEADPGKAKERATKLLTFVYFFADLRSPFQDMDEEELRDTCISQARLAGLTPQEDELLSRACAVYEACNDNVAKRMILDLDRKLDQIRKKIRDTEPQIYEFTNPKTGEVKFSSNIEILTKAAKEVKNLVEMKKQLAELLMNDEAGGTIRGQKAPSMLEEGDI